MGVGLPGLILCVASSSDSWLFFPTLWEHCSTHSLLCGQIVLSPSSVHRDHCPVALGEPTPALLCTVGPCWTLGVVRAPPSPPGSRCLPTSMCSMWQSSELGLPLVPRLSFTCIALKTVRIDQCSIYFSGSGHSYQFCASRQPLKTNSSTSPLTPLSYLTVPCAFHP